MSKSILLKLKDDIFQDTEDIIHKLHIARNAYINKAVEFYNNLNIKQSLKKQLEYESKLVSDNSMQILKEFEDLEDNILE